MAKILDIVTKDWQDKLRFFPVAGIIVLGVILFARQLVKPADLTFSLIFLGIAVLASLFYGWKCLDIFKVSKNEDEIERLGWPWRLHQRFLNFVGSLIGWITLWDFLNRCAGFLDHSVTFGLWDLLEATVAFVGITGYLPLAVVGFIEGLRDLAAKLTKSS